MGCQGGAAPEEMLGKEGNRIALALTLRFPAFILNYCSLRDLRLCAHFRAFAVLGGGGGGSDAHRDP